MEPKVWLNAISVMPAIPCEYCGDPISPGKQFGCLILINGKPFAYHDDYFCLQAMVEKFNAYYKPF